MFNFKLKLRLNLKLTINKKERLIMRDKVEEVIGEIRPSLQADGGDVELVNVTDDGVVEVELQGACAGCPMSQMTLKNGIERKLKEEIPEVKKVKAV